jgi:hypothetical protein
MARKPKRVNDNPWVTQTARRRRKNGADGMKHALDFLKPASRKRRSLAKMLLGSSRSGSGGCSLVLLAIIFTAAAIWRLIAL